MNEPVRWKIDIERPETPVRSVPLLRELVIGRDADVDLRLNDSSVSRRHARIGFDAVGTPWIEDLESGNGVVVDGVRIDERTALHSRSVVAIGAFSLTLRYVGEAAEGDSKGRSLFRDLAGQGPVEGEALPNQILLRFRNGPLAGRDVPMIRRKLTLGRIVDGNEIVVPDESLSRHHAEFERVGRGFAVRDLQSVNGTAVNGGRVVERLLKPGDRLKFGLIEAVYFGPDAKRSSPVDRRVIRRVLLGSVMVVLLLIVIGFIQQWRAFLRRRALEAAAQHDQHLLVSVERSLTEAEAAVRDRAWTRALRAYEEAERLDPVNPDVRKGLSDVRGEIAMQAVFDRAQELVNVGQVEDGVTEYLKIAQTSIYFPAALAEVSRLAELLKRRYGEECEESRRAGDQLGIILGCGHYLNLVCNGSEDAAKLKLLRAAEAKLGKKDPSPPWSCPATYARWFSQGLPTESNDLVQQIARKYEDPKLAEVVRIYATTDSPKQALAKLDIERESAKRARDAALSELYKALKTASGEYNDGVASLQGEDLRGAEEHWKAFLGADQRIMPSGTQSTLADSVRGRIAKEHTKLGDQARRQGRLEDAYREYVEGSAAQPGDEDLQKGFLDLEHAADRYIGPQARCKELVLALRITRDSPPSPNHRRADDFAVRRGCSDRGVTP